MIALINVKTVTTIAIASRTIKSNATHCKSVDIQCKLNVLHIAIKLSFLKSLHISDKCTLYEIHLFNASRLQMIKNGIRCKQDCNCFENLFPGTTCQLYMHTFFCFIQINYTVEDEKIKLHYWVLDVNSNCLLLFTINGN